MKTIKAQELLDVPVTSVVLEQAIKDGQARNHHRLYATDVGYSSELKSLIVSFADESAVVLPIKNYPELNELSTEELSHLNIGFGGSALYSDSRDLHVSIAGLVAASEPLMAMASTLIASRNGRQSSPLKKETSRKNGLKGGRPPRLATV